MKAYLETRRQKAKGAWPKRGPDTYVAVQIVPENVEPLHYLNRSVAEKRGIEIKYFGEGYSNRTSSSSMLGIAMKKARDFCKQINNRV
jgi:hypothetical protein